MARSPAAASGKTIGTGHSGSGARQDEFLGGSRLNLRSGRPTPAADENPNRGKTSTDPARTGSQVEESIWSWLQNQRTWRARLSRQEKREMDLGAQGQTSTRRSQAKNRILPCEQDPARKSCPASRTEKRGPMRPCAQSACSHPWREIKLP
jgi:hypothetical protein